MIKIQQNHKKSPGSKIFILITRSSGPNPHKMTSFSFGWFPVSLVFSFSNLQELIAKKGAQKKDSETRQFVGVKPLWQNILMNTLAYLNTFYPGGKGHH